MANIDAPMTPDTSTPWRCGRTRQKAWAQAAKKVEYDAKVFGSKQQKCPARSADETIDPSKEQVER
jgi:hypothetical protein